MMNYLNNIFFDEPINYKGLDIHPVIMKDYLEFHWYSQCLMLDKNSIVDVEIISMSYLKFLYYVSVNGNSNNLYSLVMLLCMVFKVSKEDVKVYIDNKDNDAYFKIRDIVFNSDDFEEIKKIISLQNNIDTIDYTIQKEIRDSLEKAEDFKRRQSKNKMGSLEEQMICVLISTSLKLEDIYNMTIRKFEMTLKRVDEKMHYEIYLSASMSGFVKFKEDNAIKHWMSSLDKDDKYEDVKVSVDSIKSKIDGVSAAL